MTTNPNNNCLLIDSTVNIGLVFDRNSCLCFLPDQGYILGSLTILIKK